MKLILFEAVVFADLQIHAYNRYATPEQRLDNCLNVIDAAFDLAKERGIESILFAGDLFEKKTYLQTMVVNETTARFKKHEGNKIDFYAISGNHDQATKNYIPLGDSKGTAVSSMKYLADTVTNFHLVDNAVIFPTDAEDVELVTIPYYEYEDDLDHMIGSLISDCTLSHRILMLHQSPKGQGNELITTGFDPYKWADKFDAIICGDIHKSQIINGNCLIPGSPIDRDLADVGTEKGLWIFRLYDDGTFDWEFNSLDLKFPKIVIVEGDTIPERLKDQYVELIPQYILKAAGAMTVAAQASFNTSLDPKTLIQNYLQEAGKEDHIALAMEAFNS